MVSLDLSGESLHRRGYRGAAGEAPLKENVAAGVLLRSGWADLASGGADAGAGTGAAEFLDPMCGSGTFVIEAALIAADRAPGLDREYFGFLGWAGHDVDAWERLLVEARARARAGMDAAVARGLEGAIRGRDRDSGAVRNARGNAERAGVQRLVRFDVGALADAAPMAERAGAWWRVRQQRAPSRSSRRPRTVRAGDRDPLDAVGRGLLAGDRIRSISQPRTRRRPRLQRPRARPPPSVCFAPTLLTAFGSRIATPHVRFIAS